MPNTAQTEEWNGATGTFWAAHDERYDATLRPLTERLFAATPIAATDHVLDVGCGCGNTTRIAAKRANQATTLGVDLSEPMLAQARLRSDQQGLTNVWYERADVQTHDLGASRFDMVISRPLRGPEQTAPHTSAHTRRRPRVTPRASRSRRWLPTPSPGSGRRHESWIAGAQ